jgi:hypothetical protein
MRGERASYRTLVATRAAAACSAAQACARAARRRAHAKRVRGRTVVTGSWKTESVSEQTNSGGGVGASASAASSAAAMPCCALCTPQTYSTRGSGRASAGGGVVDEALPSAAARQRDMKTATATARQGSSKVLPALSASRTGAGGWRRGSWLAARRSFCAWRASQRASGARAPGDADAARRVRVSTECVCSPPQTAPRALCARHHTTQRQRVLLAAERARTCALL